MLTEIKLVSIGLIMTLKDQVRTSKLNPGSPTTSGGPATMRSPTSSYLDDLSLISTRLREIANEFKDDSVITGLVGQVQTSLKKNDPRAPELIHALGKALDYIDANAIKASADSKSREGTFGTILRKDILAASFKTYLENDSKPSDIHNFVEFIKCSQFNSLDLGSKRFFIQEWFNPKERSFLLKSWLNISEEQGEKKLLPDTSVDAKAAGGKDLGLYLWEL